MISISSLFYWGTRWRIWMRHCFTHRKVRGSIPDGVTGIFHVLGVDSASKRNEYQEYFLGVKAAGVYG